MSGNIGGNRTKPGTGQRALPLAVAERLHASRDTEAAAMIRDLARIADLLRISLETVGQPPPMLRHSIDDFAVAF